jgi:hypothetical protein
MMKHRAKGNDPALFRLIFAAACLLGDETLSDTGFGELSPEAIFRKHQSVLSGIANARGVSV